LITKVIGTDFDPESTCPIFLRFLDQIFDGRPALTAFMQKAIGYALAGVTTEQVFFVLQGRGANGKSTLVQTIRSLLGGYAGTLCAESLLAKKGDHSTMVMNDLYGVMGARFVAAAESDAGRRLAEGLIKQLTGGETVKVKKLYANLFEADHQFKLFLSTNHRPVIRGDSDAMWRRVRLIPFDVVIPDAQQDHALFNKLQAERAGILRWAVEGCLAWQREGLGQPEEVRVATRAYKEEMDTLGEFFAEHCVFEDGAAIAAGTLYTAYQDWAGKEEEQPMSKKAFGLLLKERGLTPGKVKGERGRERGWRGIRLRRPDEAVDALSEEDAFEGHFQEITPTRVYSESFSKMGPNASNASSAAPADPPWIGWDIK
jgi:putative DNA primase/helicase